MDAEQLRQLVMEPFCVNDSPHKSGEACKIRDPLYTRAPDARVPGLRFGTIADGAIDDTGRESRWILNEEPYSEAEFYIPPSHATALIGWAEATLLAEHCAGQTGFDERLTDALASDTPRAKVKALVTLHHRLLDQREQADA